MTEEKFPDEALHHSLNFIKMAFAADWMEIPARADGCGKNVGACGDTVEIFLVVQDETILSCANNVDGCINTRAAANTVALMTEGLSIRGAWEVTPEKVIEYLETMPAESEHCAQLAVGALYKALADYQENKRHPWKKLYQIR